MSRFAFAKLAPLAAFATSFAVSALAAAAPRGAPPAAAAPADDLLGRPVALVVALALVSLLPFVLMTTTAFVKVSTTLQIARSAIGAQGVPSNTVVTALAAALAILAMAPVIDVVTERARPLFTADRQADSSMVVGIVDATREPLRDFLQKNASARERARFVDVARRARPPADRDKVGDSDLVVLVPAFITTELYEAFALGFAIYLPFLVVDLVIANVLLALGMQQLSPTQVSLPFKLLLFVAVDGWGVLARALVGGYRLGRRHETLRAARGAGYGLTRRVAEAGLDDSSRRARSTVARTSQTKVAMGLSRFGWLTYAFSLVASRGVVR